MPYTPDERYAVLKAWKDSGAETAQAFVANHATVIDGDTGKEIAVPSATTLERWFAKRMVEKVTGTPQGDDDETDANDGNEGEDGTVIMAERIDELPAQAQLEGDADDGDAQENDGEAVRSVNWLPWVIGAAVLIAASYWLYASRRRPVATQAPAELAAVTSDLPPEV